MQSQGGYGGRGRGQGQSDMYQDNKGRQGMGRGGGGGQQKPCNNFQKGNCTYGDRCRFSHDQNGQPQQQQQQYQNYQPQTGQQGNKICKFILQGKQCYKQQSCQFSHDISGNSQYPPQQQQNRCNFKFNWGICDINDQNCNHKWNKEDTIKLAVHIEDPNVKFVNIFNYQSSNLIIVEENSISVVQLSRQSDGQILFKLMGEKNIEAQKLGYTIKKAELIGEALILSAQLQTSSLYHILILNILDGSIIQIQDAHQKSITGFALIQQTLFSSSIDGTIKVWSYNAQKSLFELQKMQMEQFNPDGSILTFTSLYLHQQNNQYIMMAGVQMKTDTGVAIYQIGENIMPLRLIPINLKDHQTTILDIKKIDNDLFGLNVLHSQDQNQDISYCYLLSLKLGKSDIIYGHQQQNQNSYPTVFSTIKILPNYPQNNDLFAIGNLQGHLHIFTNNHSSRSQANNQIVIKAHNKNQIVDIEYFYFEHNAIKFVYLVVVDKNGHLSVWNCSV